LQYSAKEVPSLESDIDACVTDLIQLIQREYADKNQVMDFAKLAQYFTLDSLTTLAFGAPFGFITKNKDLYDYNKTTTAFFPLLELSMNIPLIQSVLSSKLMHLIAGPKAEDKSGLGAIIGVTRKIVAERFDASANAKAPMDMLSSFIAHGLTREEAESESVLQLLAGSDSTATSIRVTLLYLLTHPVAFAKLRSEIDQAVDSGTATLPIVSYSKGVQMPYLQACIKEGLRLWQPINGIQTKVAPAEGATVNGIYIPGGTQVGWSAHSMMKRRDVFGEDADLFKPERWLDSDPETLNRYTRAWEITFSAGRFTCLGKSIALMELTKVLFEVRWVSLSAFKATFSSILLTAE
jgi:cytochrome P450